MQFQYFGILGALKLVQQLAAEHHVEVAEQAGCNVERWTFVVVQNILASLFVRNVRVHNILHSCFGRQFEKFLLAIDCVPVIDQPQFQVIGNFDTNFHFGMKLLLGFRRGGQIGSRATGASC